MEMLHGSDGWGKLVSELQQKEEDDAQQAAVQAEEEQQQPLPNRRKRGRTPKGSSHPLAQATRFDCLLLQLCVALFCNVVASLTAVTKGSLRCDSKLHV